MPQHWDLRHTVWMTQALVPGNGVLSACSIKGNVKENISPSTGS
jgi:hypothetical protein